jgi:HAD superfamily hydrolase (TIGR01450 family)
MAGDAEAGDLIRRPDGLYKGYIVDLDGTVYLGPSLLPGARRLIAKLRDLDRRVLFLSNNPTRDPSEYARKLGALGIEAGSDDVLNTVVTMTRWLLQNEPGATVFPIAEEPLKRALRTAGIRISENAEEIDLVIASYDRTFEYRKLQIAFDALWYHKRARLIATNLDRFCPMPAGRGEPDAAAIVAAIEACSGVVCEVSVGKPDPFMLDTALGLLGLDAQDCIMVGDRLYTDIRMARDAGMPSALVLTGETTPGMLRAAPDEERPIYVLERLDELLPTVMWDELGWTADDPTRYAGPAR